MLHLYLSDLGQCRPDSCLVVYRLDQAKVTVQVLLVIVLGEPVRVERVNEREQRTQV